MKGFKRNFSMMKNFYFFVKKIDQNFYLANFFFLGRELDPVSNESEEPVAFLVARFLQCSSHSHIIDG
jgi:hypothetical protein